MTIRTDMSLRAQINAGLITPEEAQAEADRRWRARKAIKRDVAECTQCGRTVGVHMPKHGDGTEYITHWHKDRKTSDWCRSGIDSEHVQEVDR